MDWELDVLRRHLLRAGAAVTDPTVRWVYMISGVTELETAATRTILCAGDAALVDTRTASRLIAVDDSEVVLSDVRQVVPSQPLPSPLVVTGFAGQHPGVAELVRGCPLEAECQGSLFALSYAGLVGAAMTASWIAADEHDGEHSDAAIANVVAALTARPGEPWTLDQMADLVHLSRSTLTERFRRTLRRSPMQMLRDVRMHQARKQLGDPSVAVTQVAFEVGYGSVAAFSRAFAAHHNGESPQGWRHISAPRDTQHSPDQPGDHRGERADEQRRTYAEPVKECATQG